MILHVNHNCNKVLVGYIYDIIKPELLNSKTDVESYVKYQFENEFDVF